MSDARLPSAYLTPGTSSFAEFVGAVSPGAVALPPGAAAR